MLWRSWKLRRCVAPALRDGRGIHVEKIERSGVYECRRQVSKHVARTTVPIVRRILAMTGHTAVLASAMRIDKPVGHAAVQRFSCGGLPTEGRRKYGHKENADHQYREMGEASSHRADTIYAFRRAATIGPSNPPSALEHLIGLNPSSRAAKGSIARAAARNLYTRPMSRGTRKIAVGMAATAERWLRERRCGRDLARP